MARKVLVLEDESSIRSFIVINLTRAGYEVIESGTGEEALEKLQDNPDIRVALLDIMLPGIDGFEVCRRIRATNTRIGIIMLTARSQEMDKVTGLMTGADDYAAVLHDTGGSGGGAGLYGPDAWGACGAFAEAGCGGGGSEIAKS